ncbi:hypothetical protein C1645_841000 [Glomus cerebriforme]|uniref:Uncharacterized protein n=1 Tax=Glomus cerebriforme TaxID=658196 RepID=A0A397S3L9_9GLOM|nr:hypothetical protein C1645_841000 [Glomus cerebriforme]
MNQTKDYDDNDRDKPFLDNEDYNNGNPNLNNEDYDRNSDRQSLDNKDYDDDKGDIEIESDCSKTSAYISKENDELTDDDKEFEESEMTNISNELQELEEGVSYIDGQTDEPFILHAYLLTWTDDIPALSKIYNIRNHDDTINIEKLIEEETNKN